MENSAGGDISQKDQSTAVEKPDLSEECRRPEENIFSHFNKKYLLLTSITSNDGKEKQDTDSEQTKNIIESMIEELDNIIKKTGNHKMHMRYLAMKTFLHHILAKLVDDSEAAELLENMYQEVKPYLTNPEVTYSGFLVMNSLSTLMKKCDALEKIKVILEECQSAYKMLKSTNKNDDFYSGKELFSHVKDMESNKEARLKFEKLVITNLLFLGSVYEKLGDHYKDIVCYHTAFSRMLNKGLVSPYKWVDFTTRLACVFIDDNNFKDARHHLSAATHVHEILEGKKKFSNDNTAKELLKNNAIHLALAWVRYCVLLFEKSKDEDRTKFIILYRNGYLFPNTKTSHERANLNEKYGDHILNERNFVFQNQRFIDSIDKELVDDENDKLYEYQDIFREKPPEFANALFDTENEHKENDCNLFIKVDEDEEKTKINLTRNEECDSLGQSSKEKDIDSTKQDSEQSSNNQFMQDETEDETLMKDDGSEMTMCSKKEGEKQKNGNYKNETNLVFSSLGYLPIEHTVTKELIQNPEEARNLFKFACGWSKQAQLYYPKNSDFYSHVHVVLNMVSLYRLCAYFQGRDNLEYRIGLEQTRENLLEQLVTELTEIQPETHLHVRLYQEMALLNIDLAMLNMCNIYNIHTDDTYKLCALAEIQSHINHTYIVGDMLERSTEINDQEKVEKEPLLVKNETPIDVADNK